MVELLTFHDNHQRIDMSAESYEAIDASSKVNLGMSLHEAAQQKPLETYRFFKKTLEALISGITDIQIQDELVVSESSDYLDELAMEMITERLPNENYESCHIIIGAYPSDEDILLLGRTETKYWCRIVIEPESLA